MIGQKDEILKDKNISLDFHKVSNFYSIIGYLFFLFFYRNLEIKVMQRKEQETKELWNSGAET